MQKQYYHCELNIDMFLASGNSIKYILVVKNYVM